MAEPKKKDSRERILQAAVVLFARQGFANTGMRQLAEEAGVNLAMINYFFGTKKGLLKEILDAFFAGYLALLEEELTADTTLEEKLKRFIHRAVGFVADNKNSMLITVTELAHDDPDITEHKARWARQAMVIIDAQICRPLAQRSGKTISPAAIGPLLINMVTSRFLFAPVVEQVSPPGYDQQFFAEYPEIIAEIFLRGIHGLCEKGE